MRVPFRGGSGEEAEVPSVRPAERGGGAEPPEVGRGGRGCLCPRLPEALERPAAWGWVHFELDVCSCSRTPLVGEETQETGKNDSLMLLLEEPARGLGTTEDIVQTFYLKQKTNKQKS